MPTEQICYSEKYYDDIYEYSLHKHAKFPLASMYCLQAKHEANLVPTTNIGADKDIAALVPKEKLMSETEWRKIGVQQSHGWVHYMSHNPEPHILLFRRPKTTMK